MTYLLAFFTSGGILFKFFEWIGKTVFVKGLILPFQFAVLGFLVVTRVSILTMIYTLIFVVFNKIHELFDYFNMLNINNPEIFDIPFKIMHNLGFFSALQDVLPLFSLVMITFFLTVLSKLTIDTMRLIATELFQIGLLTSK